MSEGEGEGVDIFWFFTFSRFHGCGWSLLRENRVERRGWAQRRGRAGCASNGDSTVEGEEGARGFDCGWSLFGKLVLTRKAKSINAV